LSVKIVDEVLNLLHHHRHPLMETCEKFSLNKFRLHEVITAWFFEDLGSDRTNTSVASQLFVHQIRFVLKPREYLPFFEKRVEQTEQLLAVKDVKSEYMYW